MFRSILLLFVFSSCYLFSKPVNPSDLNGLFINDNPKLIVDWTPRAGCTIVWKTLLRNYGLLDKAMKFNPWVHNYRSAVYTPFHQTSLKQFLSNDYYKIKFVRCPYHRAVSSYIIAVDAFKFKGSFEDFLQTLMNPAQRPKNFCKDPASFFYHAKVQHSSLDDYMDKIIKIEDSQDALVEVNLRLGLNLDLSKESSEHHTAYIKCDSYVGDKPFYGHQSPYGWPVYYCFYSQKTLDLVQAIYRDDIESYDYDIPEEVFEFVWEKR